MKRIRPHSSSLSDARLKALLRALRGEADAPEGFSARVLESLRAQGLLARAPGPARPARIPAFARAWARGQAWLKGRFGGRSWVAAAPRWSLAAAALVLAAGLGLWTRPAPRPAAVPLAHASAPASAAVASARPAPPPAAASVRASRRTFLASARPRSRPAALAARSGAPAPRAPKMMELETDVALSSVGAKASAPAAGLGTEATSAPVHASGPVAASAPFSPAGPGPGPAGFGGAAGGTTFMGGAAPAGAGSVSHPLGTPDKPTPTPVLSPSPTVEAQPSLGGANSQVRNNVILASGPPDRQSAQILFNVAQPGQVLVAIYSRLGDRVAVLQDGPLGQGQHELSWSGQSEFGGMAASGIYAVVIHTPTYTDLDKVMLVK